MLQVGKCRSVGFLTFTIYEIYFVNSKIGDGLKEFSIPIRGGRHLISILNNLTIKMSKKGLIIELS